MQLSFNIHKDLKKASYTPSDWRILKVNNFSQIQKCITLATWSCSIFENNYRAKKNFIQADIIAIDVDDGTPLSDAVTFLKTHKITSIVGTTRNHQKQKGDKPPCDRYRIVLQLSAPITKNKDFTYTVNYWRRIFGGDKQTTDSSRLFYPCKDIVFVQAGKIFKRIGALKAPEEPPRTIPDKKANTCRVWLARFLTKGILLDKDGQQSRNYTCFIAAMELFRNGYTEIEVINLLLKAPFDHVTDWSDNEIFTTVRSAKNYSRG